MFSSSLTRLFVLLIRSPSQNNQKSRADGRADAVSIDHVALGAADVRAHGIADAVPIDDAPEFGAHGSAHDGTHSLPVRRSHFRAVRRPDAVSLDHMAQRSADLSADGRAHARSVNVAAEPRADAHADQRAHNGTHDAAVSVAHGATDAAAHALARFPGQSPTSVHYSALN